MGKSNKRSYSRAFSRSRSRSKSSRLYRPIVKKVKTSRSKGNKFLRELGATAGELAGAALPFVGASRGRKIARRMISSVFGHGDYYLGKNVRNNSLMKLTDGTSPPSFSSDDRTTCVRHREYITDITSSTGFKVQGYEINPGIDATFPWLATVARNYECYRLKGMLFEFKSMSADALNSINTALGTVIMATQYNAASAAFVNKQQMENYEFAQSCKPSSSMLHYIECARNSSPLNELYIRGGDIPTNQPQQLYDIGDFYIATQGMQQADVIIGELWVTYDIELFKPKLIPTGMGSDQGFYGISLRDPTEANLFGDGTRDIVEWTRVNSMECFTNQGTSTITLPPNIMTGTFLVQVTMSGVNGTSDVIFNPSLQVSGGVKKYWQAAYPTDRKLPWSITFNQSNLSGSSKTTQTCMWLVQVTGPNMALQFLKGSGPYPPPASECFLHVQIAQINPLLGTLQQGYMPWIGAGP